jgi:hypothetical protein
MPIVAPELLRVDASWLAAGNCSGLVECHRRGGRHELIARLCVDAHRAMGLCATHDRC